MKNHLIIIICIISILAFMTLGIILVNSASSIWAIIVTALSIIPAFFLYSSLLSIKSQKQSESSNRKKYKSKSFYAKSRTKDNGKILYFPKDKNRNR